MKKKHSKPKKRVKKALKSRKRPAKKKAVRKSVKKKPIRKKASPKKRKAVKKRKPVRKLAKRKKVTRKKPKKKRIVKKRKKTRATRRAYSTGGSLEQLFESPAKVQIMKLFFRNPEQSFLVNEAAKIMRQNLVKIRQEIKRLEKIGLLKGRKISSRKQMFAINPNFDFFNELKELILKASPVSKEKMLKTIKGLGKIKLVLLSGVFVGDEAPALPAGRARADLLIVGDNISQRKLNTFIKNVEAEAGTEINCVVMTTEEFNYRYDMYDRFVRGLLDEKSEFLVNRLGV